MNLVAPLGNKFGEFILRQKTKGIKRSSRSCSLHEANSIGILFNATYVFSFEIVKQLAKELSSTCKNIMVLGFVDSKQMIDHYLYRKGFEFFTRNHLNWHNKPDSESVKDFIKQDFDILFYLSLDNVYPLKYILSLSKAKFKVGRYLPDDTLLDLMIDIEQEKQSFRELQEELAKEHANFKNHRTSYDNIAEVKTNAELELNFLINQLVHYLSQIKK